MKTFIKKNKFEILFIFFILIVNILLKVPAQAQGIFAFATDQGRDFIDVSKIIYDHKFTLIGPTTGLPGFFYGPWWYYFLSPILFISEGDPQIVAIFFSAVSIITTLLLYFLIKSITKNVLIALILTITASMSSNWFGPTSIWSPSLVPFLTISYIYILKKIFETNKTIYYFLLGLTLLLILDGETAFGISILTFQLISIFLYRKTFFNRKLFITFLGALLILAPRIIFDLRHNFLISRSIITYLQNPTIHASKLALTSRLMIRSNQIFSIISESLFRSHKLVAVIFILVIILLFLFILKKKKVFATFKKDLIFHYLLFLFISILITFSIFKDNVWDYYLIGLPVIFICILAKIFEYLFKINSLKPVTILLLSSLLIFSFNKDILKFGNITWKGDDATYKNPKTVIDYLVSQNPTNYSFYAYSSSIFDYPFDYLIYWYAKKGILESPKVNQKYIYLVIRDDSTHRYFKGGWYGDKTKDKTQILDRKTFNGNIILEKHKFND